uniref:Uncharacterized protein n=1 Tax=Eutreptiella gymnastica TaxID=73025 RepID=A0A7S4C9C8_9EUGL
MHQQLYLKWQAAEYEQVLDQCRVLHEAWDCDRFTYSWLFSSCTSVSQLDRCYEQYLRHAELPAKDPEWETPARYQWGWKFWYVYVAETLDAELVAHLTELTKAHCKPRQGRPEVMTMAGVEIYEKGQEHYNSHIKELKAAIEKETKGKGKRSSNPEKRKKPEKT